jgi:hypothetical protein
MAEEKKTGAAADDKRTAEERKKQATEREERAKAQEEHRKSMRGRPTPTQEEADLIKSGHHPTLEPDGSTEPPWPPVAPAKDKHEKHATAESGGANYSTRQTSAKTA